MVTDEPDLEVRVLSHQPPPDELVAVLALRRALEREQWPHDPELPEAELAARLASTNEHIQLTTLVAWSGDEAVGIAEVELHYFDSNADRCEIEVEVHPRHRRRGIGLTLARELLHVVGRDGRRLTTGWGPVSDETDGFWCRLGAPLSFQEHANRLDMAAVDPARMAEWIDDRHGRAGDLELIEWVGPCPHEHLEMYTAMKVAMSDAPMGDLDYEPDTFSTDQMRSMERSYIARGYEHWVIIVVDPATGEAVAHTEVQVNTHRPTVSIQNDTVVVPAYRGRRIGRWMKAEMWRRLRERRPEVEILSTFNAGANDHILAINHAMGYRYIASYGGWQSETAAMAARAAQLATGEPG